MEKEGDIPLIIKERNLEINKKSFAKNIGQATLENRVQAQPCIRMNE